jgi:hypothetical protein
MNLFVDIGVGQRVLAIAGAAGLAAAVIAFVPSPLRVFDLFDTLPVPEVKAPPPLVMTPLPAIITFDAIAERPLFNADRKPDFNHQRRAIAHIAVTHHPTAEWIARQVVEAFPWDTAPAMLMRDNDGAYGQVFKRRLKGMGIRDRPVGVRSPWQNGHVERVIGSIRRECLDQVVVRGEGHLRRILASYAEYYNVDRTHLALGKDAPRRRAVERVGRIMSRPKLGGLHHRYARMRF